MPQSIVFISFFPWKSVKSIGFSQTQINFFKRKVMQLLRQVSSIRALTPLTPSFGLSSVEREGPSSDGFVSSSPCDLQWGITRRCQLLLPLISTEQYVTCLISQPEREENTWPDLAPIFPQSINQSISGTGTPQHPNLKGKKEYCMSRHILNLKRFGQKFRVSSKSLKLHGLSRLGAETP